MAPCAAALTRCQLPEPCATVRTVQSSPFNHEERSIAGSSSRYTTTGAFQPRPLVLAASCACWTGSGSKGDSGGPRRSTQGASGIRLLRFDPSESDWTVVIERQRGREGNTLAERDCWKPDRSSLQRTAVNRPRCPGPGLELQRSPARKRLKSSPNCQALLDRARGEDRGFGSSNVVVFVVEK